MSELHKNLPHLAPIGAAFGLKFHQVAIYAWDVMSEVKLWQDMGFENWVFDHAKLIGTENGSPKTKIGTMAFNYDALPCELEYVHYSGHIRHSKDRRDGRPPFLSHMSTHVENIDLAVTEFNQRFGLQPYHTFTTSDHSNPAIRGRRHFREAIFNTTRALGFDIKMIQRVSEE